jgi:hypothetical protein
LPILFDRHAQGAGRSAYNPFSYVPALAIDRISARTESGGFMATLTDGTEADATNQNDLTVYRVSNTQIATVMPIPMDENTANCA